MSKHFVVETGTDYAVVLRKNESEIGYYHELFKDGSFQTAHSVYTSIIARSIMGDKIPINEELDCLFIYLN